jgi:hypothetical protein
MARVLGQSGHGPAVCGNIVNGDFARILAEFWVDGPNLGNAPGHWNAMPTVERCRAYNASAEQDWLWTTSNGTSKCILL